MARKKREPGGGGPKRRRRKLPGDFPDRRAMEGMRRLFIAGLQGQAHQDTPLGQAQALLFRAGQRWNPRPPKPRDLGRISALVRRRPVRRP